ncbi:MAG: hypothetical protein HQM08_00575 [Candidatus Riflebacteria bacterium]|nr:hypothetical protein [Candidatus Riflebacteria bacterium]
MKNTLGKIIRLMGFFAFSAVLISTLGGCGAGDTQAATDQAVSSIDTSVSVVGQSTTTGNVDQPAAYTPGPGDRGYWTNLLTDTSTTTTGGIPTPGKTDSTQAVVPSPQADFISVPIPQVKPPVPMYTDTAVTNPTSSGAPTTDTTVSIPIPSIKPPVPVYTDTTVSVPLPQVKPPVPVADTAITVPIPIPSVKPPVPVDTDTMVSVPVPQVKPPVPPDTGAITQTSVSAIVPDTSVTIPSTQTPIPATTITTSANTNTDSTTSSGQLPLAPPEVATDLHNQEYDFDVLNAQMTDLQTKQQKLADSVAAGGTLKVTLDKAQQAYWAKVNNPNYASLMSYSGGAYTQNEQAALTSAQTAYNTALTQVSNNNATLQDMSQRWKTQKTKINNLYDQYRFK